MSMVIRTNFNNLQAQRIATGAQGLQQDSMRRLSSGMRITRASDDAAGLAISEKMRAAVTGSNMAVRNANEGVSLLSVVDASLASIGNIVQRVRDLAVGAANGTLATQDHFAIGREMAELMVGADDVATRAEYNTIGVLATERTVSLHVGINPSETLDILLESFRTGYMKDASDALAYDYDGNANNDNMYELVNSVDDYWNTLVNGLNTAPAPAPELSVYQGKAGSVISTADTILNRINSYRAVYGSLENRLQHTIAAQSSASVNLAAAGSRIRDVDVAAESSRMTHANILSQATLSIMAQANQSSEMAISLLKH